jgi:Zn-dependent alcohol dehydrogenase
VKLFKSATKFGQSMFGRPRTLSEKASRALRGKNPFTHKVTVGSIVGRPVGRLVTATVQEGADAIVLGTLSAGIAALWGLGKGLFRRTADEVVEEATEIRNEAEEVAATTSGRRASGR